MMIPIDNKLKQPPNDAWKAISRNPVPVGEQVALTDAGKEFVWIGCVSSDEASPPSLVPGGTITSEKSPAYWSHIGDQK